MKPRSWLAMLRPRACAVPFPPSVRAAQPNIRRRRFCASASREDREIQIGYVTDIEGNLDHFNRFLAISRILEKDASNELRFKPSKLDTYFVFGGDMFDKGPGDIRLSSLFVGLKQRYPDRVFLLMGNRDINKLVLSSELDPIHLNRAADIATGPYYRPDAKNVTPKHHLRALIEESLSAEEKAQRFNGPRNDYDLPTYRRFNTRLNRLKFLLKEAMSCSAAFEHRRKELAEIHGLPISGIGDEMVVHNFATSVEDSAGCVRRYLEHAQLGVCLGNTLFVHGGVDELSMGFVPSLNNRHMTQKAPLGTEMKDTHTVQEWIDALNVWGSQALAEHKEHPKWDAERGWRGGESLMAYHHRAAMRGRGVTAAAFIKDGQPHPLGIEVCNYLNGSGIRRLVVGHKPFGDSPTVVRNGRVEAIDADTSYSDTTAPDNRGCAVSEVVIQGTPHDNYTNIHGILRDGRRIDFNLPPLAPGGTASRWQNILADKRVGTQTEDGWWVKAAVSDSNSYRLSKGKGYDVWYKEEAQ